jgi:hypothetical protein
MHSYTEIAQHSMAATLCMGAKWEMCSGTLFTPSSIKRISDLAATALIFRINAKETAKRA